MTKRTERVRASGDFAAVRQRGRSRHSSLLSLAWVANARTVTRIGYVVSKRVGKATVRNLVKRRLRALMQGRHATLPAGYDLIITAKPGAAAARYDELGTDLDRLIQQAHLRHIPRDQQTEQAGRPKQGEDNT